MEMQRQEGTAPLQKLSVAPSQTRHSALSNKSGSMHHPHSRYLLSYLVSLSLSKAIFLSQATFSVYNSAHVGCIVWTPAAMFCLFASFLYAIMQWPLGYL